MQLSRVRADITDDEIQNALFEFIKETNRAQMDFMKKTGLSLMIKPIDPASWQRSKRGIPALETSEKLQIVLGWLETKKKKEMNQESYCRKYHIGTRTLRGYMQELKLKGLVNY